MKLVLLITELKKAFFRRINDELMNNRGKSDIFYIEATFPMVSERKNFKYFSSKVNFNG